MKIDPWMLALVVGAGAIVAFWTQVKGLLVRIASHFVTMVAVEDSSLARAVRAFCFARLKQSVFGMRRYCGIDTFVRPINAVQSVAFEKVGSSTQVFWRGWRPLWVKSTPSVNPAVERGLLNVTFIRGTFNADALLLEALDYFNAATHGGPLRRYRVMHVVGRSRGLGSDRDQSPEARSPTNSGVMIEARILRWRLDELGPALATGSPIDELVLPEHLRVVIDEARFWRKSEKWYREKGVLWRRGWLVFGRPGNGKTSLARAVAEELDLPVFAYDLASLSNEELRQSWNQMLREAPCMALIEDIDSVFDGRSNVTGRGDGLSFDSLLNCIDGIERANGVFLIITTNDISRVDHAIGALPKSGIADSSRPGRIDRIIEMVLPDAAGLRKVCQRILPDRSDVWASAVEEGIRLGETVAQFQERCARLALTQLWEGFHFRAQSDDSFDQSDDPGGHQSGRAS